MQQKILPSSETWVVEPFRHFFAFVVIAGQRAFLHSQRFHGDIGDIVSVGRCLSFQLFLVCIF